MLRDRRKLSRSSTLGAVRRQGMRSICKIKIVKGNQRHPVILTRTGLLALLSQIDVHAGCRVGKCPAHCSTQGSGEIERGISINEVGVSGGSEVVDGDAHERSLMSMGCEDVRGIVICGRYGVENRSTYPICVVSDERTITRRQCR